MASKGKSIPKFTWNLTLTSHSFDIISTKFTEMGSFEEMNKMISQLMDNCAKFESEIELHKEEKKKLEDQNKKLNNINVEAVSYKKKFNELCDRNVTYHEEISKLKKEIEDRKKDNESLKESHRNAIEKKDKEIAGLGNTSKDAEAKYQFYIKKKDKEIETILANHQGEELKYQETLLKKDQEIEGIISTHQEEELKYEEIIKKKDIEIESFNEKIEEVRNAPRNEKEVEMIDNYNKLDEKKEMIEKELVNYKKKLVALAEAYKGLDSKNNKLKEENEENIKLAKNRQIELQTSNQILNDELAKLRKLNKETIDKLNEAYASNERIQAQRSNESKELEELKLELGAQMEKFKEKMKLSESNLSTNSIISLDQIKEIISDCLLYQYQLEKSINYNDLIEKTLKYFNQLVKASFNSINARGSISLLHENLKEIYFQIYTIGNPTHHEVSGSNMRKDLLNAIVKQIASSNVISSLEPKKYVNDYLSKLPSIGLEDDINNSIVSLYNDKREAYDNNGLSGIDTLVKRCSNSIFHDGVKMGKKELFSFKGFYSPSSYIRQGQLYIDNTNLTDDTSEYVIHLIKYPNEKIHSIEFVGTFNQSQLSKKTIKKILCCISTYLKLVQCFILRDCNLRTNIIDYIAYAIDNLKQLKVLHFQSNAMSDEDHRVLCDMMKTNTSCIELRLVDVNIVKSNAIYIADCLTVNKSIKTLVLANNKIIEEGLLAILNVIGDTNAIVETLDLSSNTLREEDYHSIANFISRNPPIKILTLSDNILFMNYCVLLGSCLNKATTLKRLNMSNMNIIADFTPVLFPKVNFEELILDDNPLGEIGQIMLAKVLHTNTTIRLLSLKNTKISAFGLTHLLNCIKQNKDFKTLHLENNILDENAIVITGAFAKDKKCKIYISKEYVMTQKVTTLLEKVDNVILV